jgi:hypothetical protein
MEIAAIVIIALTVGYWAHLKHLEIRRLTAEARTIADDEHHPPQVRIIPPVYDHEQEQP